MHISEISVPRTYGNVYSTVVLIICDSPFCKKVVLFENALQRKYALVKHQVSSYMKCKFENMYLLLNNKATIKLIKA